jgi:hypothetical protein
MMEVLKAAKALELPDWWVCAGFVRSKVWDTLHGFEQRTHTPDIDLIYFDEKNVDEQVEKLFEDQLKEWYPGIPWSVKNQARMHVVNKIPPYISSEDAISRFPETVTALGVKLNHVNEVVLTAPHGVKDVINMQVKPTEFFRKSGERAAIYESRVKKKNWKSIWSNIEIIHISEFRIGGRS